MQSGSGSNRDASRIFWTRTGRLTSNGGPDESQHEKTGERSYGLAEWSDMSDLAAPRPNMIAVLDRSKIRRKIWVAISASRIRFRVPSFWP